MPRGEGLVSLNDRTEEEKKAIASKGAKATHEVRRKKKLMRDALVELLNSKAIDKEKVKELKKAYGISDANNQDLINLAVLKKAQKGDVKACEFIRDTIGEKPVEKVAVANLSEVENEIDEYFSNQSVGIDKK